MILNQVMAAKNPCFLCTHSPAWPNLSLHKNHGGCFQSPPSYLLYLSFGCLGSLTQVSLWSPSRSSLRLPMSSLQSHRSSLKSPRSFLQSPRSSLWLWSPRSFPLVTKIFPLVTKVFTLVTILFYLKLSLHTD